ncbi:uncharacterized protein BCR38DRAFT_406998 [Pseudomassariella vexata]|uniref:Uncharacterized protein n=1 Tax=Pseudomassariella vexata TaxID=1141098 RepID=A0A1Y2E6L6_9PEZI|nr:uncharacterized protein BCR38DRAFT_406998 [Pseudomassariella vexata]ORY66974.1 hypothetical protein BCR38DRAFT_406998 [Pseudomassariella vexata]
MQLGWPSFDFGASLSTPAVVPLQPSPDQVDIAADPNPAPEDPRAFCVHQLTILAAGIDEVYLSISAFAMIHISKHCPIEEFAAQYAEKYNQQRYLEQLFTHAQGLVDLYPRVLGFVFKEQDREQCQDPDCVHREGMPAPLDGIFNEMSRPKMHIDEYLFNLLVCAHTRLTEVLGNLITHVKSCAKVALASPDYLKEPELCIPKLRVGSFVASTQASSSMQAVLLVHMAFLLVDWAKQLHTRVTETPDLGGSSKDRQVLRLRCEVLIERAESEVNGLKKIRDALTTLGFMK